MASTHTTVFELGKDGSISRPILLSGGGREGASGTVYEHPSDNHKAIKLYHQGERKKFEDKIRTMIKVKYHRPHADRFDLAWPEAIFVDSSGGFLGFKMPLFGMDWVDLESIVQASEAERRFDIGESDRLRIAANLSMAIAELHLLSIHCIDLKPENIRIDLRTFATGIIDCDGMSVIDISEPSSKRFPADKSTQEFWAPENFGIKPWAFKDEEAHDRFALATIIFMLLNRGIHPYQGVMSFEIPGTETTAGKIKNNLYPHGAGKGKISPLPATLYAYLPQETQRLFDLAFSRTAVRPSPEDWCKHLDQLLANAERCDADPHHMKFAGVGCPICARDAAKPKIKRIPVSTRGPQISVARVRSALGQSVAPPSAPNPSPAYNFVPAVPGIPPAISTASFTGPTLTGIPVATRKAPGRWRIALAVLLGLAVLVIARSLSTGPPIDSSAQAPSQQSPPAPTRCSDASVFEQASRRGADSLRSYIGECSFAGGSLVKQAQNRLESIDYDSSSACIQSSCTFDRCLQQYSVDFPVGRRLLNLQQAAQREESAPRCRPSPTFEDGEAALREAGQNVGNPQGLIYASKALNIFASLAPTPLIKDRIGRAHGMIGALSPSGPDACNHLKTARTIFVELANATEIKRTDLGLQVQGCISAPVAPPGRLVCKPPGSTAYWTCPIGSQCYGAGQCASIGPIGRPVDIGRPVEIGR